jgi:regulatory protein
LTPQIVILSEARSAESKDLQFLRPIDQHSQEEATDLRSPKKPEPLDEPQLYDYAIAALGRRMRTVAELKRLMRNRVEEGEAGAVKINAVVHRLEENHYLDDPAYAATYTRLRQDNEKFGKRRVQQELSRKGVNAALISTTVDAAYENVSEETLARKHLERKRVKQPTNEKESARVVRLLVRGGFSTGTIFKILKSWNVGDETLAAVESIDQPEE